MSTANYDVKAQLILDTKRGKGQLASAAKESKTLKQELQGATNAASGLWSKIIGIGAAYVGLNAGINVMSQLTRGAVGYTASLEKMEVGLTSVLAAVEGSGWDKALVRSKIAFEELKDMAVESPAGPQELFSIFQGIVGPIEAAGFSMQRVLDLTTDTVSAASALNVDFGQAQRDISLMVRGAAGMDVKLFSLLRSTGAIVESTEEWNKKLTQAERVEKLSEALAKFRSAGERYAKTWSGITATFGGIVQEFGRAGFAPIMGVISSRLDQFNTHLLANRDSIEATLEAAGNRAAEALDRTFQSAIDGFKWVSSHWDEIVGKMSAAGAMLHGAAPAAGAAYVAHKAIGMAGGYQAVGGAAFAAAAGTPGLSDEEMGERGYKKDQQGRWRDSAGKYAAGAAGMAAGGQGGLGALGASLSAALGPLAVALAAAGAVAAFASEHFEVFAQIWSTATEGMGTELMQLWEAIKGAFLPLLKSWGGAISMILVPAFQLLVFVFRFLVKALTIFLGVMGDIYGWIYDKLSPAFTMVLEWFELLGEGLKRLGSILGLEVNRIRDLNKEDPEAHKYEGGVDAWLKEHQGFMDRRLNGDPEMARQNELLKRVPAQRTSVTNDFRGSKITVKQEFKGRHDPDRIVQAMMLDLTRQAEMRVSSGYANALTR